MMMHNSLRDLLDEGKPTMGTHFMFVDGDVPEIIGDLGTFDYAEFVAEYTAFNMTDLYHLARAAQCGNNLPLMIKPDQSPRDTGHKPRWVLASRPFCLQTSGRQKT